MKTTIYIFISILLLLTAQPAPSQTNSSNYKLMYETLRDELYITYLRLDSSRSIGNAQANQIYDLKNENLLKDSVIKNRKLISDNSESQKNMLKNELAKKRETGFLEFRGFYAGVQAYYRFDDSVITKQTMLGGLKYDITGTVKFTLNGVLDFETGIAVPIRNEKFAITIKADWKIL